MAVGSVGDARARGAGIAWLLIEARNLPCSGGGRWRGGLNEQAARAGGILLLGQLLIRLVIARRDAALLLGMKDRRAEIAGQWRAERRRGFWQVVVAAWQAGDAVGDVLVLRIVEFLVFRFYAARLQRPVGQAEDGEAGDGAEADQHPAREPRDAGPVWPQAEFGGKRAGCAVVGGLVGHGEGAPSVRTMRTRCSELPSPICSSAAANKVSTIMSVPRTR